jgi:ATP-dependent DNA ligase
MGDMKEISMHDLAAARAAAAGAVNEVKIDGSRHTWDGQHLISERGIDRANRFPHVVADLQKLAGGSFRGRMEIAVPYKTVLDLNASENWGAARGYIFEINELLGKDWKQAPAEDVRAKLEELFPRGTTPLANLRIPFVFKTFDEAWAYITAKKLEGVVIKPSGKRGGEIKVKLLEEAKLEVIGHEAGAQKGAFLVRCPNGNTGKVSALSVAFIAQYQKMLADKLTPYLEIEFPFYTKNGIPFQPRLRRMGTLAELKVT